MNEDIGIIGLEVYIPKRYVSQSDLESYYDVSQGKYTIGLAQSNMSYVGDLEVTNKLLKTYHIDDAKVGRLEVGTETKVDHSKSIKSCLMQLFKNKNIVGIDNTNACYGGTAALFNSLNWLQSSICHNQYAIVVCGDIAIYERGPARPTGGCGAVAMLLGKGKEVKLKLLPQMGHHFDDCYDFFKPKLDSEYPVVDGMLSQWAYLKSFDQCFKQMNSPSILEEFWCFHCPYTKLVSKVYARLYYLLNKDKDDDLMCDIKETNKEFEQLLVKKSKTLFETYVQPSLYYSKEIGNLYTGSLYLGLISLICHQDLLPGQPIYLYSFGSGLASSIFGLQVTQSLNELKEKLKIHFQSRINTTPQQFEDALLLREQSLIQNFVPKEVPSEQTLFKGTYYLSKIDESFRREYQIFN